VRYAVVGGGVLGLTAGLRLAQRGHEVVVVERSTVPGGLASSFEVVPGAWLERFYHHIFRTDRAAVALIEELGLGGHLRWHRPVSTVMVDGVPRQLDSPGSLLAFRRLAMLDRLRMAAVLGFLKLLPSPRLLEGSAADAWMRRACGAAGHRLVWGPLLQAKFGDAYDAVSMPWLWARLHDRTTELGYLDGGFHQLYAALAEALARAGGTLVLGATVSAIERDGDGVAVAWSTPDGGGRERFDRVVSTLAPAVTARVAPGSGLEAVGRGARTPLSAHCLVLSLDRPLTGIYWIGAADRSWPFLAVVEHTALLPPSAYGDRHLVYLGAYRPPEDDLPRRSVDEQVEAAGPLLRTLNPAFDPSWIRDSWSFAEPFAQPIVDTGYRSRIPGFQTGIEGLSTANMFQVYPHDRGQNYSIELAARLVAWLER
jgi:protoporphyrinogen oxidase